VGASNSQRNIFSQNVKGVEEIQNEFAKGYRGRASDEFWGWGGLDHQKMHEARAMQSANSNAKRIR